MTCREDHLFCHSCVVLSYQLSSLYSKCFTCKQNPYQDATMLILILPIEKLRLGDVNTAGSDGIRMQILAI